MTTPTTAVVDLIGNHAVVGVFGEQVVGGFNDDISVQFQYGIDTNFDCKLTVTGDGAAAGATSLAVVSSTTGTARLESRSAIRYRPGHTGYAKFTASFVGAGTGRAGCFDAQDGMFISVTNGVMSLSYRNAGVDTTVSQSEFNGEIRDLSVIDFTKINVYRFDFGYLGVADISLWVFAPNGLGWLRVHSFYTAGNLIKTHIGNPVIPIAVETSGAMTVKSASWSGGSLGIGGEEGVRPFQWAGTKTLSGTNLATIAVFSNKATFLTKTNKVNARLTRYRLFVSAPSGNGFGTVQFQIIGNATLAGTPTPVDINANSSVMTVDTVQTYASGGNVVLTEWLDYVGSNKGAGSGDVLANAREIGLIARPNDTFTITAQNVAGSDNVVCRVAFNWQEEF